MRLNKINSGAGTPEKEWPQYFNVSAATVSYDGRFIASAHTDGSVNISGFGKDDPVRRLIGYKDTSRSAFIVIRFSRNGKYLATVDQDGIICVWDVLDGALLARVVETTQDANFLKSIQNRLGFNNPPPRLVNDIAFSQDDRFIAAARGDNRSVHIFAWSYFAAESTKLLNQAQKFLN